MEKGLTIHYYEEGDELNVLVGKPTDALYVELTDEVYVRLHPETREVLGFTIANFRARSRRRKAVLPILGRFALPRKTAQRLAMSSS
ncbi:MAG: hypothetical protein FJ279_01965 [Planctomycetes bacterium]|nr:hypothetical protein [Planctomycetota bacterium]